MAKALILLFIIVAGFIAGPLLSGQTGYVLIVIAGYRIETSLVVLVLAVVLLILLLWLIEWVVRKIATGGKFTHRWAGKRKASKARALFTDALNSLLSADFEQAQKKAERSAHYAKDKQPAYLVAALAAEYRHDVDTRQKLLHKAAIEQDGQDLPFQLSEAQTAPPETALTMLNRLLAEHPQHPGVQRIAAETFYAHKQWQPLQKLLPALEKQNLVTPQRLNQYQVLVYQSYFGVANGNLSQLHERWKALSAKLQQQPDIRIAYASALQTAGHMAVADRILVKGLRKSSLSVIHLLHPSSTLNWENHNLLNEYIQQYLKGSANDADALALLGAISIQQGEHDLALRALRNAIQIKPAADYYRLLGDAYLASGQSEPALSAYREAAQTL